MAGDNLGIVDIQAREACAFVGDVIVRGAVGAVAADVVLAVVLVRQGVHIGVFRHGLMEGRVEHHHLGHVGQNLLAGADAEQMGVVMERCELGADLDLVQHVVVHQGAAVEIVGSLHDAVTYCLDVREALEHSVFGMHKVVQHELHSHRMVGNGDVDGDLFAAGRLIGVDAVGKADFFHYAFGQDVVDIVAAHVHKSVLDGGGAAIDYEYYHLVSFNRTNLISFFRY